MFACQECGKLFRTTKAAERAAYGDEGCPKCGSSDVDLATLEQEAAARPVASRAAKAAKKARLARTLATVAYRHGPDVAARLAAIQNQRV